MRTTLGRVSHRAGALAGALAVALVCAFGLALRFTPAAADTPPGKRCVNLGNALEAPREGEWGYRIDRRDLAKIAAAGFDAVRVPVNFSIYAARKPPYTLDSRVLRRVDQVLDWAQAAGLSVRIDVHHYEEIYEDAQAEEARFLAIWRQLATRYRARPPSVAFELLNEPRGSLMDVGVLQGLQARALAVIRETNPTRWVIVSGPDWGTINGLDLYSPPNDPRVATSISFYDPFNFTHQHGHFLNYDLRFGRAWGQPEDIAEVQARVARAAAWAQARNTPLVVGEFGVYRRTPLEERAAWMRTAREAFDAHGLAWCAWDFAGEFPIYDRDAKSWIEPMRRALLD